MNRAVCIIQGHPHGEDTHLCHALAKAYADGARLAGARVHAIDLGQMDIPLLRNPADFASAPSQEIALAQEAIADSRHVVVDSRKRSAPAMRAIAYSSGSLTSIKAISSASSACLSRAR